MKVRLAEPIRKLIESFENLPGIGPKTASRLVFYLLHVPQEYLEDFGQNLANLKKDIIKCSVCFNISQSDPCPICKDQKRDRSVILVVEDPLDLLALERTNDYQGVYHVLHGSISPLNNIGPEELYINQLLTRVKNGKIKEVILATNPDMEGEATAMFIKKKIAKINETRDKRVKISRIGLGLPTGADLEYADQTTLKRAIEGRRDY